MLLTKIIFQVSGKQAGSKWETSGTQVERRWEAGGKQAGKKREMSGKFHRLIVFCF
jgi:hypothetical protein